MNIFDILKEITYNKKGNILNNLDNEQEFQPFLIQRWLSMISRNNIELLNSTTNRLYNVFETKQDWYKAFLVLIPKQYPKSFNYIKKNKKEKQKNNNDEIEFLAESMHLSKREIKEYVDLFDIKLNNIKKAIHTKES